MNKKYQTLIVFFAVIAIIAFIVSCRKNETIKSSFTDGAPVPDPVVQQLKSWHTQNMATQQGSKVNANGTTAGPKILNPIWTNARYKLLAGGEQAITVDAPGYTLSNKAYTFYRIFVYDQQNGVIEDGHIVEFYAKEGALKNVQQYLTAYNQAVIPGFNGAIITYDINYHYKNSRIYKDGRQINGNVLVRCLPLSEITKDTLQVNSKLRVASTRVFDDEGTSETTPVTAGNCTYIIYDTYYDGQLISSEILDYSCKDSDPGPGADPVPPSGGSDGAPPPPPPTDCDSYTKIVNGKRVTVNCNIDNSFIHKINDTDLKSCFKSILDDLNTIHTDCIGDIIDVFSGSSNPNFNWIVKSVDQSNSANNAVTLYTNKDNSNEVYITTTFYLGNFESAGKIAAARNIIHESVHAYLEAYYRSDPIESQKSYPQMFEDYIITNHPTANSVEHNEMARSFIGTMATQLELYGQYEGISKDYQYYEDMAWGGLYSTAAYNALPAADRTRIETELLAEQSQTDPFGNSAPLVSPPCNCN